MRFRIPLSTRRPQRAPAAAPEAPARHRFVLHETVLLDTEAIPSPPLRALAAYWEALRDDEALPSLRDVEPDRAQVLPGRVHLVRVEGPRRFRFLHYGTAVTNPGARDMAGLTTQDYDDPAFGALVTEHYAEAVAAARPLCRAIRASQGGSTYDYVRVVAPFTLDGDGVNFLLVATQRLCVPAGLDRPARPVDLGTLRDAVDRTRRLSLQVSSGEAAVTLAGLAAAAALHFAEATLIASGRDAS